MQFGEHQVFSEHFPVFCTDVTRNAQAEKNKYELNGSIPHFIHESYF